MEGIRFLKPSEKFLGEPRGVGDIVLAGQLEGVSHAVISALVAQETIEVLRVHPDFAPPAPSGDPLTDAAHASERSQRFVAAMERQIEILTGAVADLQAEVRRLKTVPRTRRASSKRAPRRAASKTQEG